MQITPTQPYLNAQNTKSPRFGSGRAQSRVRQSQVRTQRPREHQQFVGSAPMTKEQIIRIDQFSQWQKAVIEQLEQAKTSGEDLPEALEGKVFDVKKAWEELATQFTERNTSVSPKQAQQIQEVKEHWNVISLNMLALENRKLTEVNKGLQNALAAVGGSAPPPSGNVGGSASPSAPESPTTPASSEAGQKEAPAAEANTEANAEANQNQNQKPKWPPKAERSWKNVPWHMTKQYFGSSKVYWDLAIGGVVGAIAAIGSPVMAVTIPMALAGIATLRVLSIPWKLRQGAQSDIVDEMYKSWEQ